MAHRIPAWPMRRRGLGRAQSLHLHDRRHERHERARCNGDTACNFGYQAGLYAYNYAQLVGVNPLVSWWLDVENPSGWSSNLAENAQEVQGPSTACGIRHHNVGIYASPDIWNEIVGDYQPAVPLWWLVDRQWTGQLPEREDRFRQRTTAHGPVFVTQYADMVNGQSSTPTTPADQSDRAARWAASL